MVKRQLKTLWDALKPPVGIQARRVVMAYTALVVIGRFGLTRFTSPGSAAGIDVRRRCGGTHDISGAGVEIAPGWEAAVRDREVCGRQINHTSETHTHAGSNPVRLTVRAGRPPELGGCGRFAARG